MSLGELIQGKYELVALAGEGGMATVYKGLVRGAAGFARPVAIKRIKPEYRGLKNYIAMFIEEARVGAELAHPNIVQVYDFVIDGTNYCLIMEWVEGIDLGSLIRAFRLHNQLVPWQVVVTVCIGAARGLAAAHERKAADGTPSPVIHRDVSPHNILLGEAGAVKLSDFGLARARDRGASLTAPGTVKGKLAYLAPEVTFGKPNSAQSDLFSLAIVMWEALTHARLFDGGSDLEVFKAIRACVVPDLSLYRSDVPLEIEAVMRRALAKDPNARFPSAHDFALALTTAFAQQPVDAASMLRDAIVKARGLLADSARQAAMQLTADDLSAIDSQMITRVDSLEISAPSQTSMPIELVVKKA